MANNPNFIHVNDLVNAIKMCMTKSAATPPMDPAMMGGGAPVDPAMMGGGGGMPMDPSMMGGAPPMDPAMMGGGAPIDPAMLGLPPVAPPPAEETGSKKQKPEEYLGDIRAQLHAINQQLSAIMNSLQVSVPPESLVVPIDGMEGGMPSDAGAGALPPDLMGGAPADAGLPPDAAGKSAAYKYAQKKQEVRQQKPARSIFDTLEQLRRK